MRYCSAGHPIGHGSRLGRLLVAAGDTCEEDMRYCSAGHPIGHGSRLGRLLVAAGDTCEEDRRYGWRLDETLVKCAMMKDTELERRWSDRELLLEIGRGMAPLEPASSRIARG